MGAEIEFENMGEEAVAQASADTVDQSSERANAPRFLSIELTNFLSYKAARLDLDQFTAIVGPNASGKSNVVAAIKLLRDIPTFGLPTAVARRGGYDQLRHRSQGRPYDPAIRLTFQFADASESYYELSFAAVKGKRYKVKREVASVSMNRLRTYEFESDGSTVRWLERNAEGDLRPQSVPLGPGQSALATGNVAAYLVYSALLSMQIVEINPAHVADLQDPSSTREFEPTGSNTASVFEVMTAQARTALTERLAVVVPSIQRIEPRNLADKQTLYFFQETSSGNREFSAKHMSDGTLRAFGILLALLQPSRPSLIVIEEPEVAIHLGALQSLVEVLRAESSNDTQIIVTTHSADIIDALPIEALRVVFSDDGESHIAQVSEHSRRIIHDGLITPGDLLRADALDPELI